jgi:hypothetical protein
LAALVVRYHATVPAIFALEGMKPLSFVGSQALYFFEPMVRSLFTIRDYERFAALLERRENLEILLVKIESHDDEARRAEKAERDRRRAARAAARAARKESR